jgi:hypothetical protein
MSLGDALRGASSADWSVRAAAARTLGHMADDVQVDTALLVLLDDD